MFVVLLINKGVRTIMANSTIGVAIATLVVGGLVGFGIGNMAGDDSSTDENSSQSTSMQKDSNTDGVTVGGAKMVKTLDIVDNAVNASNVTTVVDLVKQADLVNTLKSTGPFTVFAPNNDAFAAVPEALLAKVGGSKELLTTVLTYHVVPGTYTTADLRAMANSGMSLTSVQGGELKFSIVNGDVVITDIAGQSVSIETSDVISSNGVTHVIKSVMLPVDPATL